MSEYSSDISIDIHALDIEWERQPSLMQKYSVLYADCASLRDAAKEELARIDGEIDWNIRSDWNEWGFETKPTDAAVKATIVNNEDHIKAVKELQRLNRETMILQGVKTSLDHKKSALERLTTLYLSGYWADPKIRGEAKTAYQEDGGREGHLSHLANNERIGGKHGRKKTK